MSQQQIMNAFFNLTFYRRKKEWKLTGDEDEADTEKSDTSQEERELELSTNHEEITKENLATATEKAKEIFKYELPTTATTISNDDCLSGWLLNESQTELLSDPQLLCRMSLYEEQVLIMRAEHKRRIKMKEEKAEAEKLQILKKLFQDHKQN